MSKKSKKNKVVVSTKKKDKLSPAVSKKRKAATSTTVQKEFIFNKANYTFVFIGLALIALGMLLMMGGNMPDANTWDESLIYSKRRTLLAPIIILAGLGMQVYAIFKK